MVKTKIVCTIGPASGSRKIIAALIKNGMDVARLNFSHGDQKTHYETLRIVREEASRQRRAVAVLQDLQGIKIRTSDAEGGSVMLKSGSEVRLCPGRETSTGERIFISYPALLRDVKKGECILIDDGLIKLEVLGKTGAALRARVAEGGELKSRKGVNFPASKTTARAFTEKDRRDLAFGLKAGVDYVAISFVRTAADMEAVAGWARKRNIELPPLIAKIEKPEALDNIDEIMNAADGIMVARGDLGVELPTERVPMIQKMLIDLANKKGKLVITATQMLESMTGHSRPTRAEASDVANAVLDGTDALMLSAETATGRYPVESVMVMDTIIRYTEENFSRKIESSYQIGSLFAEAVADSACRAAGHIGASAIVVFTNKGFTARLISKLRPSVPVIAFTPDEKVQRQLALCWGVSGKIIKWGGLKLFGPEFITAVEKRLLKEGLVKKGDNIVLVASSPFLGNPNVIRLHRL